MNELTMGQRIAQERKRLGLSQEALGERMGISRQAISKWESDGAVPEIDKLIALSKLFGVSVGWLLGVEEQQENRTEELNETQLKMVEEIVRRYRPAPAPNPTVKGLRGTVSLLLMALALAILVFTVRGCSSGEEPELTQQISQLQSDYSRLQGQLSSIDSRLDDMAVAAEAAEDLLLEYELHFEDFDTDEKERAVISVLAIPKAYSGGSASLTVLQKGQPVTEALLDWNGAGFGGSMVVPLGDDYQYCFALETDGSRQVQILEAYELSDLASGSTMSFGTELFGVHYDPYGRNLEIHHFFLWAEKPVFGDDADLEWTECAVELYRNGALLERRSLLEDHGGDDRMEPGLSVDITQLSFRSVKLEEGDTLELRTCVALGNGLPVQKTASVWQYSGGQLTAADHIE